ncbi:MAG: hypothetical protein H7Z41_11290, partial [Cytophagales bacterium]|nr:hypothetical protein [Armatimonadota bacterium]
TALDVAISLPELTDVGTFWLRRQSAQVTFAALYQECLAHPEVLRSRDLSRFHQVRASRHFWCGERMLLRRDLLSSAIGSAGGSGASPVLNAAGSATEIALILRPDYYQVGPPQFLHPGVEYTYLDAEVPIGEFLPQILGPDESSRCFEIYFGATAARAKGQRLDPSRSLAAQGAFPAWQESSAPFPTRARLRVQARRSALIGAFYLLGALAGGVGGFFLVQRLVGSG